MTSYLACLGKKIPNNNIDFIIDTINPLKTLTTKIINNKQGLFAVSFHKNAPLKGNKYFDDENWTAVFAGDIIEKSLSWKLILKTFEIDNYKPFNNLSGYFSIAALNKEKNKLYIVSDRRSQLPLFYLIDDKNVYISTELSTFCRLPVKVTFNAEWLREYLFFYYPIGQTTFLENVKRMPPASILEINLNPGEYKISEYAPKFQKKEKLLKGKKSLEHAYSVCKDRIPKYFTGTDEIACALTSGWDSRTNLSFCPNLNSITSYTYGVPGCKDLIQASKTAKALNIKHQEIIFDKKFVEKLPTLMMETIYLSSGLERITRSSLLHIYKVLTDSSNKYPVILSGIFWDGQFRGHAGPAVISPDMIRLFSTGEKSINEEYWKEYLGNNYKSFKKHILKIIDNLEKNYGKLSLPESLLSYQIYELAPKHYAGELSVARHFTTVRVPAWDNDIVDLSYSIEHSALSYSEYQPHHKRGSREETLLQSYLLLKNGGALSEIPVGGVPPKIVQKGTFIYHLIRIKNLLPGAIKSRIFKIKFSPQEDWRNWLNTTHREFIDNLIFSEDSRVRKYIDNSFLEKIRETRDIDSVGKSAIGMIATVEIILRLIENKWERYW